MAWTSSPFTSKCRALVSALSAHARPVVSAPPHQATLPFILSPIRMLSHSGSASSSVAGGFRIGALHAPRRVSVRSEFRSG